MIYLFIFYSPKRYFIQPIPKVLYDLREFILSELLLPHKKRGYQAILLETIKSKRWILFFGYINYVRNITKSILSIATIQIVLKKFLKLDHYSSS